APRRKQINALKSGFGPQLPKQAEHNSTTSPFFKNFAPPRFGVRQITSLLNSHRKNAHPRHPQPGR
ncbi:MAG: hypothetical protein AAGA96_11120, partial [Verrucomicrobiota bacterium]